MPVVPFRHSEPQFVVREIVLAAMPGIAATGAMHFGGHGKPVKTSFSARPV
jgi:hypothetical protein